MKTKLLLQFADWLEQNIKPEQFKFSRVVSEWDEEHQCGTVCCAMGWLPLFNASLDQSKSSVMWDHSLSNCPLVFNGELISYDRLANKYFKIPLNEAVMLFTPVEEHYIFENFSVVNDIFDDIETIADEFGKNENFDCVTVLNSKVVMVDGVPMCMRSSEPSDLALAIRSYVEHKSRVQP